MYDNFKFELWNFSNGVTNEHGEYVEGGSSFVKYFVGDIQNYNRDSLKRDYGFDLDCTNVIFVDNVDADIKINSTIIYNNLNYSVVKIPWQVDFMEIVVKQNE